MEAMETVTNVVIGVEAVLAVVLAIASWRESRFLQKVGPLLHPGEDLPLYRAISFNARYTTLVVAYLLVLTAAGAAGFMVAAAFPPLRAINGALILGLLAGPLREGRAMRQRARSE